MRKPTNSTEPVALGSGRCGGRHNLEAGCRPAAGDMWLRAGGWWLVCTDRRVACGRDAASRRAESERRVHRMHLLMSADNANPGAFIKYKIIEKHHFSS